MGFVEFKIQAAGEPTAWPRPGVPNSRPSQPFSAARETILKLLMNFGSIAMDHRRTDV